MAISDDVLAEVAAISHANRPYWRVMLDRSVPEFIVICAQPFDERDYDQDRFLTGPIYDEQEARARADYANYLMPPHMRNFTMLRLLRRVYGSQGG